MKFLLVLLLISNITFANEPKIEDAPMEWLITNTVQEKIDLDGHLNTKDKLIQNIFQNVKYNSSTDEIILVSNKKTNELRFLLIDFLKNRHVNSSVDEKYEQWLREGKSPIKVTLYKTNYKAPGFYYMNHIHTNISQDNDGLTWLKFGPKKTFSLIENFLKRRRTEGTVAFTDHDTDIAFDRVSDLNQGRLNTLRGVEWGGKTHMCLVGINQNWENLPNGRTFQGEESVRQSRSSGGFRIINHPNRKTPFPYTSWLDADGIEVWNTILENSPFLRFNIKRSKNRDALKQWSDSLALGKKYTAVGGSDFHFSIPCLRDRSLIYPVNFIPGKSKDLTKDYLHQGRVSFITRPTAPKLTLKAKFQNDQDFSNMGADLIGSGMATVQLFGDFSDVNKRIGGVCYNVVNNFYKLFSFWKKSRWEMRFFNIKGQMIAKRWINPKWYNYKKHFKAEFKMPINGPEIIRAELWSVNKKSKKVDLLGATNPIYFNRTSN